MVNKLIVSDISENKDKKKYELAGPFVRIFARIFDLLLVSIIGFSFSFLFFINSSFTIKDIFQPLTDTTPKLDGWRVLMITIILFIFSFLYFNVLPFFWKGYTLFKFIFKIRIYSNDNKKSFFWLIFKHEFLIWFLIMILNIIFGIVCTITNNPFEIIKYLFNFNIDLSNKDITTSVYFGLGVFFKTMYAFTSIVPAILVGYMFFHQKKKAFHDIVSNTFVYNIVPITEKKKIVENNVDKTWELPGLNDLGFKKTELKIENIIKTEERYKKNKKKKEELVNE